MDEFDKIIENNTTNIEVSVTQICLEISKELVNQSFEIAKYLQCLNTMGIEPEETIENYFQSIGELIQWLRTQSELFGERKQTFTTMHKCEGDH